MCVTVCACVCACVCVCMCVCVCVDMCECVHAQMLEDLLFTEGEKKPLKLVEEPVPLSLSPALFTVRSAVCVCVCVCVCVPVCVCVCVCV